MLQHYKKKISSVLIGVFLTAGAAMIIGCDNDDSSTSTEWVGYFTTLGSDGTQICDFEVIADLTFRENSILSASVYTDDSGVRHDFRQVGYIGSNQMDSNGNAGRNSLVLFYQTNVESSPGEFINPGIYNLIQNAANDKEWRGFWVGRPNAPQSADIIQCPYVLIQEASDSANLPIPVLNDDGTPLDVLDMSTCTGSWAFFSNPCRTVDPETGQINSPTG